MKTEENLEPSSLEKTEKMCLDTEHVSDDESQLKKKEEEVENAVTSITSENHSPETIGNTSPGQFIETDQSDTESNHFETKEVKEEEGKEEGSALESSNDENSSDIKNNPQNVNNKNEDQIEPSKQRI